MADSLPIDLPSQLREPCANIARAVRDVSGRACMVGGAVRDGMLGIPVKDVDIEVFGVPADNLRKILGRDYSVIAVGASFGVFKLRGVDIDVSLPRRESKKGAGHKGFVVEGDPMMTIEEAAMRRDFTINAMYRDLADGSLIDPLGGEKDLKKLTLRHCGPRFVDDPLRVLRAMQFIARFGLNVAPETLNVCRGMTMEDLPAERLFEEWKKLLLKGTNMSAALTFLRDSTWLRYFPELEALVGCEQDKTWHPEGDAWAHTLHCMDAFASLRTGDEYEDTVVGLATLCHDFGKPSTTFTDENGRIRAFGHDVAGEKPTRAFLDRITRQKQLIEDVVSLVKTHMQTSSLFKSKAGTTAIRRLAMKVRIDRLVRVTRADMRGTPPTPHDETPCDWLLEKAHDLELQSSAPKPMILGRHLIELGMRPGPDFTPVLDALFEAQLDGAFKDEAGGIEMAKRLIREK
jgi:tRNA nucleotidyltransferase (CCA-adding enzyme)